MHVWFRRFLFALAAVPLLALATLGAVIAFDAPSQPPTLAAGDTLPGIAGWNMAEVPPVLRVAARDGAPLAYRLYPGRPDRAIVLVHGSSGASISMHKLAQSLQAAGASVYSISLRGHGGSGMTNGDTSYKTQLDDDLVDFVKATGLADARIRKTLAGFSSGGGFVLRTAANANRLLFDDYLAISPYVGYDSPTSRPKAGGWVDVAVPRVVALTILDRLGLPLFQALPVVRFATEAAASDSRTPVYSYRLQVGMQLGLDWRAAIGRIDRPLQIIVGSNDALFIASEFKPLFERLNPAIGVTVVPGPGHLDMIVDPVATQVIATRWRQMPGNEAVPYR